MAQLTGVSTTVSVVKAGIVYSPMYAGEALSMGNIVYLKNDGFVYKSGSAIVDDANHPMFTGIVVNAVSAGSAPCTVFGLGSRIKIADSGLTIGARYYSGSTSGLLDTTKNGSADTVIAKAVSATDIEIVRSNY